MAGEGEERKGSSGATEAKGKANKEATKQGVVIRIKQHRRGQAGKGWNVSIGFSQRAAIGDLGDTGAGGGVGVETHEGKGTEYLE